MPDVIFDEDGYRIEFHGHESGGDCLIYTFTPFMFSDINKDGFGVKFLFADGYDVVSFKCVRDSWFQNLPIRAIEMAAKIGRKYKRVVTYGSSMGGFAAIAFADLLSATDVIAISPQYSIRDEFDKRWSRQAAVISDWAFEIHDGACKNCHVTLLYDDFHRPDTLQVEKIIQKLNAPKLHQLRVPFSGHPAGHLLSDTKQLSSIIRAILNRDENINVEYVWSKIRNLPQYIFRLGCYAAERGRVKLALLCFFRVVLLDSKSEYYKNHLAAYLIRVGGLNDALERGGGSAARVLDNADFRHHLSVLLNQAGQVQAAIDHSRRAVELAPDRADFRQHLSGMLNHASPPEA